MKTSHAASTLLGIAFTAFAPVNLPSADGAPLSPAYAEAAPICAPDDLRTVSIPNTVIESVAIDPEGGACLVTAIVTHPPAGDRVKIWIALPMRNWNGRFHGNGGGGLAGGYFGSLWAPLAQGFATGATDTGHEGDRGAFMLNANGRHNWQEIRDFAYQGIHDMTVVGKALTQAFYGKPPRYSYFVGGSTGGRQGLMEAQRFPEDYDGIIAYNPAINFHRLVAGGVWPQLVMLEAKHLVPRAKLDAVTAAVVKACDAEDGVVDGVIDDPIHCRWDPKAFVGTQVGDDVFTEADADVVRKIWEGPRGPDGRVLWFGLPRGANLFVLAGTGGVPLAGRPTAYSWDVLRYALVQNANWDWTTLTRAELELLYNQSVEMLGPVWGTDDPDLTRFRDRGGKLLLLHGLSDERIPPQGTIDYFERVQHAAGGPARTAEFARLFLIPGGEHSFRGAGPSSTGELPALIEWVESGRPPARLLAETRDGTGKVLRSRPLFPYPLFAKYGGQGRTDDAANFVSASPQP
ncbi:MAG TPA: tannase/feruloyl esterase family alpha/beta hydrolase [Lacunisphaera sp.]|nr:tannase/feruloyl esterase family alpha/beta hydrolase [Lacunisphaera sp.]